MLALGGIGNLLGPVETIGGYQPPLPSGKGTASLPTTSPVRGRSRLWSGWED